MKRGFKLQKNIVLQEKVTAGGNDVTRRLYVALTAAGQLHCSVSFTFLQEDADDDDDDQTSSRI